MQDWIDKNSFQDNYCTSTLLYWPDLLTYKLNINKNWDNSTYKENKMPNIVYETYKNILQTFVAWWKKKLFVQWENILLLMPLFS